MLLSFFLMGMPFLFEKPLFLCKKKDDLYEECQEAEVSNICIEEIGMSFLKFQS